MVNKKLVELAKKGSIGYKKEGKSIKEKANI